MGCNVDYDYRWASESGANAMPYPEELVYLGYEIVRRDGEPCRYPPHPTSVLMRRAVERA